MYAFTAIFARGFWDLVGAGTRSRFWGFAILSQKRLKKFKKILKKRENLI
jgi:hypothetical protein